jgi:hypothetical protein
MPGVIVSDDMIERAAAVLIANRPAVRGPDDWINGLAREVVRTALNPPEDRACRCGCPHERTGNSAYFEDACRTRYWKERTGYVRSGPGSKAPSRNGGNGIENGESRLQRPGGKQISLGPGVGAVRLGLMRRYDESYEMAERLAGEWLTRALPLRQRARERNT